MGMYKFGFQSGVIHGILMSLGIEPKYVPPKTWQKALDLKKGKMSKTPWKNLLKAKAQELFPNQKVTLATADALLILEFARRQLVVAEAGSPSSPLLSGHLAA